MNYHMTQTSSEPSSRRGSISLKWKLLVPINLALFLGLATLLSNSYRRESLQRIQDRRTSMTEEAVTLSFLVKALRQQGTPVIQKYIDEVCIQMSDQYSPGHHIAVRIGDELIQAQSHHRASPDLVARMIQASQSSTGQSGKAGASIVVGYDRQEEVQVFVAERVDDILNSVRGSLLRQFIGVAAIIVIIAAIINIVLLRVVTQPLGCLARVVRGIGAGQPADHPKSYRTSELNTLAREIDFMSASLAKSEKERNRQIMKAKRIQERLIPDHPVIPQLKIECRYRPTTEVSGDYYDFCELKDGSWIVCVADVSGHGVPAAMVAAILKTLLLSALEKLTIPGEILQYINDRFRNVKLDCDFASMIVLKINQPGDVLEYASAGHTTCYFLDQNHEVHELTSTGPLLGINSPDCWLTIRHNTHPRDRFLLITDGVTEMTSPSGVQMGEKRIAQFFEAYAEKPLQTFMEDMDGLLANHHLESPVRDDVTIVAGDLV